MANEPKLRKKNIEDLEDRVTILEGGTPEPHSNTMTKPELEDLEDRITVLEGGTPGEHSNPMRFEFFTSVEDRVEELEDEGPNLININVGDELEGFWIKPRVEIDPTDSVVSQAYTHVRDVGNLRAEFALSSCSSTDGGIVANIKFDSDSDNYIHQTLFDNEGINILYKRVETDASISGNDVYELSGVAEIDGTSIDLSTITRPIYIPISDFFTDPIVLQGTGSSDSCDELTCRFFFKEV